MDTVTNIALVGGGLESFMGPVHRAAMAKAGMKIVTGAFGSSRQSSFDCSTPYEVPMRGVWGSYRDMVRHQGKLPPEERVAFISVVTPNAFHYPVAMSALDAGIPILSEKPFSCTLDEAANLARKQKATGVPYRVAMVYPAYSQLVKARKLLRDGVLGTLRTFAFSMSNGWMAPRVENNGNRQAMWRTDARRNGAGGVISDCSAHCQFTFEWLTGLRIAEVCAEARACVPGRMIPDAANVCLRTEEGLTGTFALSQIAVGRREGLEFTITGDKGTLRWRESVPGELLICAPDGSVKTLVDASAPGGLSEPGRPFAGTPAYIEALGRIYREFAESLRGKTRRSRTLDARILGMTAEEGLRSVAVAAAIVKSAIPPPVSPFKQPATPPEPAPKWVPVYVPVI